MVIPAIARYIPRYPRGETKNPKKNGPTPVPISKKIWKVEFA